MSGSAAILLGVILGLMMAFDMGGPLNKVAYSFAAAGARRRARLGRRRTRAEDHGRRHARRHGAADRAGAGDRRSGPGCSPSPSARTARPAGLLGRLVHHRGRHPVRGGRPAAGDPGDHGSAAPSPAACRWPSTSASGPRTAASSCSSPSSNILGYLIALVAGVVVGAVRGHRPEVARTKQPDDRDRHRLSAVPVTSHHHRRSTMPTKTVVVGSAVGLHARPAAIISEAAGELDAEVTLADPRRRAGRRQLRAADHDPRRRQRRHGRGLRRRPGRRRHDRRPGRAGPRRLTIVTVPDVASGRRDATSGLAGSARSVAVAPRARRRPARARA